MISQNMGWQYAGHRGAQGVGAFRGFAGLGSGFSGPATGVVEPGDIIHLVVYQVSGIGINGDKNTLASRLRGAGFNVINIDDSQIYAFGNGSMVIDLQAYSYSQGRGSLADTIAVVNSAVSGAGYQIVPGLTEAVFRGNQGAPAPVPQNAPAPMPAGTVGGSVLGGPAGWSNFWQGLGIGATTGTLIALGVLGIILLKK